MPISLAAFVVEMDKESMAIHTHTMGFLFSHVEEQSHIVCRKIWMQLESVILSEM